MILNNRGKRFCVVSSVGRRPTGISDIRVILRRVSTREELCFSDPAADLQLENEQKAKIIAAKSYGQTWISVTL